MSDVSVQLPSLYPKQRAVFYSPARVVVCEGTTKSGKSVGGLTWLMQWAFERQEPGSAIWTAMTHGQAMVMFERVCRWMSKADPGRTVWDANKMERTVTLGKGRIRFFGGENHDAIYGSDYHRAVIDEASRQPEEAWHAVRSTLSAVGGSVRIVGNVRGRRNWAYAMARKAEAGEPGMEYHRLTADDAVAAKVMTAEEIEDASRALPHDIFRQLYYAEPSSDDGNPFGAANIDSCIGGLSSEAPVCFGIDLARKEDWTVVVGLDAAGRTCLFERWHGHSWETTIVRIVSLVGDYPSACDATGIGDVVVEAIRAKRPNVAGVVFTQGSKQALMEGLCLAIQRREVSYPAGPIVSELQAFEYSYTKRGVTYGAPSGAHDDCVCALALAVSKWSRSVRGGGVYVGAVSVGDVW